jgi:hypothetical protein
LPPSSLKISSFVLHFVIYPLFLTYKIQFSSSKSFSDIFPYADSSQFNNSYVLKNISALKYTKNYISVFLIYLCNNLCISITTSVGIIPIVFPKQHYKVLVFSYFFISKYVSSFVKSPKINFALLSFCF